MLISASWRTADKDDLRVGIDVPDFGDWFHITKTAISVGNDVPFLVGVMLGHLLL